MQNVIKACEQYNAKLVFFDNVYMYDPNSLSNITEENPVNPSSKKGKVRAKIAQMIMDEVKAGRLTAMIVRAADFYGPGVNTSAILETVYKNLKKGKKANWLGDVTKIHSLTYTPDAAKATALLGNTTDAYNQIWHLPTDSQKFTGKDWIELFAKEMKVQAKYLTVSKGLVKFIGIFNPLMRELGEMMYQNDRDYFFNSSKFNKRFPEFRTTSYHEGVKRVVGN
jgi:nucleoside-diphosphate-sugar epimerase